MAATRAYDVEVNGHRTTLLLSDADAKARGVYTEPKAEKPAAAKRAPAPRNKARTAKAAKPAAAAAKPAETTADKADGGTVRDS
jgi:hypothetical protein